LVCAWDFDNSLADRTGQAGFAFLPSECKTWFVDETTLPGVVRKAVALGVLPDDAPFLIGPPATEIGLSASYTH
jgi:hypothetical protein